MYYNESRRFKSILWDSKTYGPLLVIVLLSRGGERFLELIQYNDREISYLKRLIFGQTRITPSDRSDIYFNRAAEIVYLLINYEGGQKEVSAYDFDGNELFKHDLDSTGIVDHIENNLFLNWDRGIVKVFNVTKSGTTTLWEFQIIDLNLEIEVISYNLIKGLESVYFESINHDISESDEVHHVKLFDVYSGKKIYDQNEQPLTRFYSKSVMTYDYNWHMGEVATKESLGNNRIIKIETIDTHNGINLKHLARLACMKSLSVEYMSERLPKCLHRHVGIGR